MRFTCLSTAAASLLTALCVHAAGPAAAPLPGEPVAVPGGAEALARFLDGVSPDDPRMLVAVNRRLLRVVRADGDLSRLRDRSDLLRYLDVLDSLRREFAFPVRVERSRLHEPGIRRLAERLGFRLLRARNGPWDVDAPETEEAVFGRRVAAALGWRVADWVRMADGLVLELRLPEDRLAFPMPLRLASELTRNPVASSDALRRMAADQSLGLVMEGRWVLAPQARSQADVELWRRLYQDAPILFHRYGPSLGAFPGEAASPSRPWESFGAPPSGAAPHPWLQAVGLGHPERAYLRQSFEHLPAATRRFWERAWGEREPAVQAAWVAEVLQGVRRTRGDGLFTRARGDGATVALRWWIAAEAAPMDGAMTAVARTPWLSGEVRSRVPLRRALRSGLGPLLGRTPAAPVLLEALAGAPTLPDERIPEFLPVVRRLTRDAARPLGEARLSLFQAGWVLLHRLQASGRLSADQARAASARWLEIHGRAPATPAGFARAAAWWRDRLQAVEAPAGWPGREPLERAWLYLTLAGTEPGRFRWRGLRLQDERSVQLAAESLAMLEGAGLPSWGELLAVFDAAAAAGEPASPREALRRLLDAVTDAEGRPASWLAPPADRVVAGLRRLLRAQDRQAAARLPEAARRTVLLATPAFRRLATATAMLPVLARYPDLPAPSGGWLRAHRSFLPGASDPGLRRPELTAWSPAVVVEAETAPDGRPWIVGDVAGIPQALVQLRLRGEGLPPGQSAVFETRRKVWTSHLTDPAWAAMDPAAPGAAAALVAAGDAVFECAQRESGPDEDDACRSLLSEVFGSEAAKAWLRADAAREDPGPLARFQAGWALGALPASHPLPGVARVSRTRAREARQAVGASAGLQRSLRSPAPRLFGEPWRALEDPWPHGVWFRREASVPELAERELADLRVALLLVMHRAELPPSLAGELGLLFIRRLCASVPLPTGWDGGHAVHSMDRWSTYLPEDLQHAVRAGWVTASPEP